MNENIHGFNVEYDESSETVKNYLKHLKEKLSREEIKALIESAQHDPLHKVHLEDKHSNRVTLEYKGDNSCLIRKRLS
jgi:hypothetical protein